GKRVRLVEICPVQRYKNNRRPYPSRSGTSGLLLELNVLPLQRDAVATSKVGKELPGHAARTPATRRLPFDSPGTQLLFCNPQPIGVAITANHGKIFVLRTGVKAQPQPETI